LIKEYALQIFCKVFERMIVKRITILLPLFIFGIVIQVRADATGSLDGTFHQGNTINMRKFQEGHQPGISYKNDEEALGDVFSESPGTNKRLNLVESIDRIFSLYKLAQTKWRYKLLDHQGIEETKSLNSEYGQSSLELHPNVNRYFEENSAKVKFELLQSRLKWAGIFILFHLSFNQNREQRFLEMHLTPSSDKGVTFFIPF
jgi:hypothetical protein